MKLTRERKVLFAILAAAVLGLLVNALIPGGNLTGPAVAKADSAHGANGVGGAPVADLTAVVAIAPSAGPGLAQRLARFAAAHPAEAQSRRDAFAPSRAWMAKAGGVDKSPVKQSLGRKAFTSRHHLMAVMGTDRNGDQLAVVDDRSMRVGDSLDGYRLVKLWRRSAVFAGPGGKITLSISTGQ